MDLVSLVKLVLRRWMVVVPILIVALAVAVNVQGSVESVFEAEGSAVIATAAYDQQAVPSDAVEPAELAEIVRLSDEVAELAAGPPELDITIVPAAANILQIVVSGDDEAVVTAGVGELVELVIARTQALQQEAGVSNEERIQARPLSEDIEAVAQTSVDDATVEYTAAVGLRFDDPTAGIENPYTANRATARLVEVAVQSDASRARVNELTGTTIDYAVTQEEFDQAPILQVMAYGTSEAAAIEGFGNVVETMGELLAQRQDRAGIPPSAQLAVEVVAAPQRARDVSPPIARTAAVTVALGALIALGAAILAENLNTRRELRRRPAHRWTDRGPGQDDPGRTGSSASADAGTSEHERIPSPPGQGPPS